MRPPVPPPVPARDYPLEGLRGLCAGAVLYSHTFMMVKSLDPRWPAPHIFQWFDLSSAAVLVFFILSGYVIGLTVTGPATVGEVRRYGWRRVLRLVPTTTVAVLLSWILLPGTSAKIVLGNLLFLQNSKPYPGGILFDLLPNNQNLWSLNYEAVYYLGFIALWWWAPRSRLVWGGLLVLTLAPLVGFPANSMSERWAGGALYWMAGLSAAWLTPPGETRERRSEWPAALLGAYAVWRLTPLQTLLDAVDCRSLFGGTPTNPSRLDFLPGGLWMVLAVTGRAPALRRSLGVFCLGWSTLALGYYAAKHSLTESDIVAAVAVGLSGLCWRWQPTTRWLARLAPLGVISFGLYCFALPIQLAQREFFPLWSGSALTYATRLIALLFVTGGLAWLTECQLQPWLRRKFAPRLSPVSAREAKADINPVP